MEQQEMVSVCVCKREREHVCTTGTLSLQHTYGPVEGERERGERERTLESPT